MTTAFRAILIDPFARTITETTTTRDYRDWRKTIGHGCDCCDMVRLPAYGRDAQTLIVDDSGLYRPEQEFFGLLGYPQPLAGRALWVGLDEETDLTGTEIPLDLVRHGILWLSDIAFAGEDVTTEEGVEHPIIGGKFTKITSTPIFRPKRTQ